MPRPHRVGHYAMMAVVVCLSVCLSVYLPLYPKPDRKSRTDAENWPLTQVENLYHFGNPQLSHRRLLRLERLSQSIFILKYTE